MVLIACVQHGYEYEYEDYDYDHEMQRLILLLLRRQMWMLTAACWLQEKTLWNRYCASRFHLTFPNYVVDVCAHYAAVFVLSQWR